MLIIVLIFIINNVSLRLHVRKKNEAGMIDVNYILIMFHAFTFTEYIINNVTRMINVNLIKLAGTRTEKQVQRTYALSHSQLISSLWNISKSLARKLTTAI